MREHKVVADEYFLCLNEIRHIIVLIQPSMVESSTGHLFRPAADHAVVIGVILVLTVYFPYMAVDDLDVPALW